MSTINNMVSSGYSSTAKNSTKNEINELRKKINELGKDKTLTAEQKDQKKKEYMGQIDELNEQMNAGREAQLAAAQNSMSGFFGGGTGNNNGNTGFDIFFGAGASMQSLKSINAARIGIENRARNLISEIRMDRLRGLDTSLKREQLTNLTSNLSIMDKNLSGNIDKALDTPKPRDTSAPSVMEKINSELKAMQEKEEKKVAEEFGTSAKETEET